MPISKADVQIILSAQDQASGVVKQFGSTAERAMRQAETSTIKLNQRMDELRGAVNTAIKGFIAYQGISFLKSAIDEAERTENTLRGLAGVARYSGEDIGQSLQAASKLAEDGLLDVTSASRALQNLLSRGYNLQESIDILTRLKDAAAFNRQGHLSMSEAVISASEGLKNENSVLVDNAGVTKNVSVMWKEYADEIGKGVNQLTQAEKRQAEYNGIMRETEAQVGNAARAMEGLTGVKAKLNVETIKLKNSLGNSLAPAFLAIAQAANWTLKNGIVPFIGGIEILSAKTAGFFDKTWLRMKIKGMESSQWAVEDPKKKADNERLIADMKRQLARVDGVVSEQIDDIVKKWSGELKIPDIGADSGKRRQDTVPGADGGGKGGKSEAAKAAEDRIKRAQDIILSLTRERDMIRAVTEEERIRWDLDHGRGKDIPDKYKQEAIAIARAIDAENAAKKAEADRAANTAAIENEIAGLKKQAETFGMTENAARLYDMALKGATAEQLKSAETIMEDVELKRRLQQVLDGIRTPQDEYNQQVSLLDVLMKRGMLTTEQYSLALQKAKENMENADSDNIFSLERLGEGIQQWSSNSIDAVVNFATTGKGQFKDFVSSALADLAKLAAQEAKMGLIKLGISLVGSYFGGGTVTGTAYNAGVAANFTGGGLGFHKGGMATEPTFIRVGLNPRIFDMAPRYHSGIGPDETAAIIRKDEGVFTPGQMKALGLKANSGGSDTKEKAPAPQNIRIINVLDPGIVENWASSAAGERVIMNVIRRNQ